MRETFVFIVLFFLFGHQDYRSAKAEKDSKERVAALYQKNLEREQTCVCTPTQNLDAFVPAPLLHSGTTVGFLIGN